MAAFFCIWRDSDHLSGVTDWQRKAPVQVDFYVQLQARQAVSDCSTGYAQLKYFRCANPVDKDFFQSQTVARIRLMGRCGKENGKIAIESFLMECY